MSFKVEPGKYTEYVLVGTSNSKDPLEGSIEKWVTIASFLRDNENAEIDDGGTGTCPLCMLYWLNGCTGCPIAEHARKIQCYGTPYDDWEEYHDLRSAEAMVDFLCSLKERQ